MNPLPPIDQVFSLVAQEEHQRTIGHLSASVEAAILMAASDYLKSVHLHSILTIKGVLPRHDPMIDIEESKNLIIFVLIVEQKDIL